ncbi:COP1-interactive protein 1-like [Mercurialis annua]|uniref:COP1-interactive protein 1-like n=1 Tax=Mercurialis annua TaxID=3986 RepID=UPI0021608C18|nr:COP1-interactive protein 1-like [Mercurialis annua]
MESIANPDNSEDNVLIKGNKKEIDNKLARILKLIRNNGQDKKGKIPEDSRKKSELIALIHEFHKQYQSLYTQYDNLRGDMGNKDRTRKEKESISSSPSSDSEYYSSDDIENDNLMNRRNKSSESLKAEFDSTDSEASDNLKYLTDFGKSPKPDNTRKYQKRENSPLVKVQEVHGSRASAEIKELEGQLTNQRMELESLRSLRNGFETQIEEKDSEMKRLHARISELGNENSAMRLKMKENETNLTSRIQILTTEVKDLQLEIDYLQAEHAEMEGGKKNKKAGKFKGLKDQAKNTQRELETLRREKSEFQHEMDANSKEISENLSLIEALKDEIATKNTQEQAFTVQIDELKLEVNSLHDQNNELEEMLSSKNKETDELTEEKSRLQDKISELEKNLTDRGNEFSDIDNESNQITEQLSYLQQELDSLKEENVRLKQDTTQNQKQVENEILNLTSKISDQQKTLQEKDDTIKKFAEERKLSKHHSLDSPKLQLASESPKYRSTDFSRSNNNAFERKIDELADKFRMKMDYHIRLLSRRIQVAEQLHSETRESYKQAVEKIEQENKELHEQNAACESELKKMKLLESDLEKEKLRNRSDGGGVAGDSKVEELEQKLKERDEVLWSLGEEKREAIRQLCVVVEYHRERYDHLKEAVSKMPIRFKKPT